MSALPRTVTIVGLGLMGGSLVRALAQLPAPPRVHAVDSNPDVNRLGLGAGVIHGAFTTLADAPPSDLLVLAIPITAMVDLMRSGGEAVTRHAALTDVGSVKLPVVRAAAESGLLARYAGSHPLCGDHRGGFAAARAELYAGATVFVAEGDAADARAAVVALWEALGSRVVVMDAATHDALVAHTSHLPQLLASVLGATLADAGIDPVELGPGGRDTTRLAASSPRLWTDILMHNRDALAQPLTMLAANLQSLRRALEAGDVAEIYAILAHASSWRSRAP